MIRPERVLGHATYAVLRDFMLKSAVEVPRALIVDLSDVSIEGSSVERAEQRGAARAALARAGVDGALYGRSLRLIQDLIYS